MAFAIISSYVAFASSAELIPTFTPPISDLCKILSDAILSTTGNSISSASSAASSALVDNLIGAAEIPYASATAYASLPRSVSLPSALTLSNIA